jgi:hypothetical protein
MITTFTHSLKLLIAVFCFLPYLGKLKAQCTINTAVNASEISDMSSEWPFSNLMKIAGTWKTAVSGTDYNQLIDASNLQNANIDANGYVKRVPFNYNGNDYLVYNEFNNTNTLPLGNYTVLWDGIGTISVNGSFEILSTNGNSINFRINRTLGNIGRIIIISSNESNNVKNIRILLPGTQNTYLANPFNPAWTSKMSAFRVVRFQQWIGENFDGNTNWNERSNENNYSFNLKGVPVETIVKFCNDYQHDAWINIPYNASDNYISALAQYLKTNLNINRKIYVEFSHELYDDNNLQTQYLKNNLPNNLAWPLNLGQKINSIMSIFKQTFALQPQRLKCLFDTENSNPIFTQNVLQQISNENIDILSTSCKIKANSNENFTTIQDIANSLNQYINNDLEFDLSNTISTANNLGLEFHISKASIALNNVQSELAQSIQSSNIYAEIVNNFINKIYLLNNNQNFIYACSNLCNNFENVSEIGLMQSLNINSPYNVSAPAYDAFTQFNNCLISGTNENINQNNSLTIMPNPSNGLFKISLPTNLNQIKNFSIQILDERGVLIEQVNTEQDNFYDFSRKLNSGIYLVQLNSAEEKYFGKLVIVK